MLKITAMGKFLDDVKSYNTKKEFVTIQEYDALTIEKVQMLNKPYIHYIDVKIMNSLSRKSLD
jgi:hypothetical protein